MDLQKGHIQPTLMIRNLKLVKTIDLKILDQGLQKVSALYVNQDVVL